MSCSRFLSSRFHSTLNALRNAALGLIGMSCLAIPATADVITLDFQLNAGDVVTNQYPSATFSSTSFAQNLIHPFQSRLILCTGLIGQTVNCSEDTFVDFTNPVNDLSLLAVEANSLGVVAQINVFESGLLAGTVDVIGLGGAGDQIIDLSSFAGVTRIEFVNIIDSGGIGWDDFTFTVPDPGFCFGDPTGGGCPCGNQTGSGGGCLNSSGRGAILQGSGNPDVGNDTLVLTATQLPSTTPGLFFQGENSLGNGNFFGDGLLCTSGGILRLQIVPSDGFGIASTSTSIAVAGSVSAGDKRHYQYWFRDNSGPCGSGSNTSNGLTIQW